MLEIFAVLVILGILASIAVPNISGGIDAADERKVADKLKADLREARSMAQACAGVSVEVSFRSDGWDIEPNECNLREIERDGLEAVLEGDDVGDSFTFGYPLGDIADGSGFDIDIGDSITVTVKSSGHIER